MLFSFICNFLTTFAPYFGRTRTYHSMYSDMRRLPAEWEPQEAVLLTWPHEGTDWRDCMEEVEKCYVNIAREIAKRETLWIVTPEPKHVQSQLNGIEAKIIMCPTNDTWARDHAFISVEDDGERRLLDFRFNAWGGKFEAALDNAVNAHIQWAIDGIYEDHLDVELEGGSIESDGRGTILTTTRCNRNPNRRKAGEDIENILIKTLGAGRVLWLDNGGLEHDDTDGHIDTLARFAPGDVILYGEGDEALLAELKALRTMEGKPYTLVPLPPYHVNFLIMNGAVLVPFYEDGDANERARKKLQEVFPEREVVGIDCRILLTQNGSLHCCTMQFPLIKKTTE